MPKAVAKSSAKTKVVKPILRDLSRELKRVRTLLGKTKLPGVEEGMSYGSPCLKVMGKFLTRIREPDILVLRCPLEEKELLMEVNPDVYFETDHYKGWPAVLIRLSKIGDPELTHRLQIAWHLVAPKKLLAATKDEKPNRSVMSKRKKSAAV